MTRATSIASTFVLLLALLVGLAGCTQDLEQRETTPGPQAAATQQSVPPSTGQPTAQPGETVVSVFTPVPSAPGEGTPTQEIILQTPGASTPVATSVPAPTAAPTAASGGTGTAKPIVHVVQPGDTLSSIAARYGTSVQSVAQANNIVDPNTIYVGQRLNIPVGGSSGQPATGGCRIRHTVKAGDWIWQIARDYGVSPYTILAANGLTIQTGSQIVPGQVLCIP